MPLICLRKETVLVGYRGISSRADPMGYRTLNSRSRNQRMKLPTALQTIFHGNVMATGFIIMSSKKRIAHSDYQFVNAG
jgi:hypothetical protein